MAWGRRTGGFRSGFKRRRTGFGRGFAKRRRSIKGVNRRVRRIEKSIETKRFDAQLATLAITNAGSFSAPFLIVQGTGDQNRVGSKVYTTSLDFNMSVVNAAAVNEARIRVACFMYKNPHGSALPAITEIWDDGGGSISYTLARRAWVQRASYRTIFDKVFTMSNISGNPMGMTRHMHIKIPKRYRTSMFRANAAAFTDYDTNALMFVFVSDQPIGSAPTVEYAARLKFQDL